MVRTEETDYSTGKLNRIYREKQHETKKEHSLEVDNRKKSCEEPDMKEEAKEVRMQKVLAYSIREGDG